MDLAPAPALCCAGNVTDAGFNRLIALVLDSVSSPHTKAAYRRALADFFSWLRANPGLAFTRATVQRYRAELQEQKLAPSTMNVRLSALRRLAAEAADNTLMSPDEADAIIRIKGIRHQGVRMGNWLSREQAEDLLDSAQTSRLREKRDRAVLALLIGCGLRRGEASRLRLDQLQLRDGRWVFIDLVGKGARVRTVPLPNWTKAVLDYWTAAAGIREGRILRRVSKAGRACGDRLSSQSIFKIVRWHTRSLGVLVAPHDLRRTHAKLAQQGGAPLEQIRFALGHASIRTTELYLGLEQNLVDAPCDHLRLRIGACA